VKLASIRKASRPDAKVGAGWYSFLAANCRTLDPMSFDILNRNGWAWRHGNDWRWPRLS
jgi:hypothetical protein